VTPVAKRVMALLVGLHYQKPKRIDRNRLARAVKRSVRTVQRAIAELSGYGWIEFTNGGNGTPGTICVINDKAWIMASVSRNGQGSAKYGQGLPQNGQGFECIRSEEVLSKGKQPIPLRLVENNHAEVWEQLDRFCATNNIPIRTGADIDAALNLMAARKPPESEAGLRRTVSAGFNS